MTNQMIKSISKLSIIPSSYLNLFILSQQLIYTSLLFYYYSIIKAFCLFIVTSTYIFSSIYAL
jgi:hypothetical protein